MNIHLGRQVLDKLLKDVRGKRAGRVDGIVLQLREGKAPQLVAIEVGPTVFLSRISAGAAKAFARFARRVSPERAGPFRIP